ncbi:unnamed protein product [Symbiodinium microadriaticum]|nr:unnamed protein product [Symbiodinium microadriaticum]
MVAGMPGRSSVCCETPLERCRGITEMQAWYDGFPEALKCRKIFQNACEPTSRNSGLQFASRSTTAWYVEAPGELSETIFVASADLSVPEGPLRSMLSGFGFQQGLRKAASAVAAQEQCPEL